MSDVARRLAIVTFVSLVAGFLFFLAVSAFNFPVRDVLVRFQWQWIVRNAAVRLVRSLPALLIFSIFLTFSLLINLAEIRANRGEMPSFFSLVNGPIVFLLVMTATYAVLVLLVEPAMVSARDELADRSEMAKHFLAEAQAHLEVEEYRLALTELRHYLAINPEDTEAVALLEDAISRAQLRDLSEEVGVPEEVDRIGDRSALTAAESVRLAERYFDAENYITALYYARLARELDVDREDAARIIGVALERLSTAAPSRTEEEERALFMRKREGYRAFEQGRFLDAYYIFQELAQRYPGDPDVRVYLRDVRRQLEEEAFFLEEILPIVALTGGTNLTFLNRPESSGREFLHIDKVIRAVSGTFALGVEALGVDEAGVVRYHFAAPYGKVQDGTLNMRAVSETDPEESVLPRYFYGSRPPEIDHVISLAMPSSDLMIIAKANTSLRSARLGELLEMTSILDDYGYGLDRPRAELLRRILEPFTLVVISLFAVGLSWQLRSRYVSRPPIAALVLVPAFPFVIYYGYVIYRYAVQALSTHLLLYVGLSGSLAVSVGLQAVLVAVALLFVATRMAE